MTGSAFFVMAQAPTTYGSGAGTSGNGNSFFGYKAGQLGGSCCSVFVGAYTGENNSGYINTMIGHKAGQNSSSGRYNVYIGSTTGQHSTGNYNTYVGTSAGGANSGSRNVFIGYSTRISGNDKLAINNNNSTPLIYGDFASDQVGINTTNVPSQYTFAVKGKAIMEEVRVKPSNAWPDYVFKSSYNLMSIEEKEAFTKENHHLPSVQPEAAITSEGMDVGKSYADLLKEVEEAHLYIFQLNKDVKSSEAENNELKQLINNLAKDVKALKAQIEK